MPSTEEVRAGSEAIQQLPLVGMLVVVEGREERKRKFEYTRSCVLLSYYYDNVM